MNVNALKNKKSLKIVALLAASLIIASASAATYSELYMYGTITIGSANVVFVAGTDTGTLSTSGVSTAGTEITFDKTSIMPGEIQTYPEAVKIQNNAGADKSIVLDVTSLTGPFSNNFDYIYIEMNDTTSAMQGAQIQMLPTGTNVTTTGSVTIPTGETWTVQWTIAAKIDATPADSISLTVKLTVQ
jgi:hypothetical protein